MTLGTALFLSVVLLLVVFHAQFRKFLLYFGAVTFALVGMYYAGVYLYDAYQARARHAEHMAAVRACSARIIPPLPPGATSTICEKDTNAKIDFEALAIQMGGVPDPGLPAGVTLDFSKSIPVSPVIELHGEETLRFVLPPSVPPPPAGFFPVVHLERHQGFVFRCGNSEDVVVSNSVVSCP